MRLCYVLAASAVTAVAASSALANTIRADFINVGPGLGVNYTKNGGTNFTGTTAGVFNWKRLVNGSGGANATNNAWVGTPAQGQNFKTFCIELEDFVEDPTNFTVASLASAPIPNGTFGPMGVTRATLIKRLWAEYYDNVVNAVTAAAFQLSVWEIVHEEADKIGNVSVATTGSGIVKGRFHIQNGNSDVGNARSTANTWLSTLSGLTAEANLAALTTTTGQDQVTVIPLPPAAFAGLGLLGIVAVGQVRRRLGSSATV